MKILYLTFESYYREAIIKSQVEQLLRCIVKEEDVDAVLFTTFDNVNKTFETMIEPKLNHMILKSRGTFFNVVIMIWFVIRNAYRYDVIHIRSYMPMFAAIVGKYLCRKKILFDPRGLFADEFSYHGRYILARVFKFVEGIFYRCSDKVIVVSQSFKEYVIAKYGIRQSKIVVIPTFSTKRNEIFILDKADNFREIHNWQNNLVFVYSGAFEKWQLINKVVDFFILIESNMSNAKFLFCSKQKEKFVEFLDGKIDADNYDVISVDYNKLTQYLSLCDYGVLFRDQDIINKVAAPIKVKDYLLAGLPIIISDNIGDSSNLVRENDYGFVLEDLSAEEMINVINRIKKKEYVKSSELISSEASLLFDVGIAKKAYSDLYRDVCRM